MFLRDGEGVKRGLDCKRASGESGDGTGVEGRDIVNETIGER